jgi:hypothetical protein
MRFRGSLAALVVLCALGAGCGDDVPTETTTVTDPATQVIQPVGPTYQPAPGARAALEEFVQAAGRRDCPAMFDLLTTAAQSRWGPTEQDFCRDTGRRLGNVLGEFVRLGKYEHVVSARISEVWAAPAIAGYIDHGDEREYGGYALPARIEDGDWKLELGGTVTFSPLTPDPALKADSKPNVSADLAAAEPILVSAMWVDGKSVKGDLSPDEAFLSSQIETDLASGRHSVVVFGETESSAGAVA